MSLAERKCGEQNGKSDGIEYVHLIEQESDSFQTKTDGGVVHLLEGGHDSLRLPNFKSESMYVDKKEDVRDGFLSKLAG